MQLNLNNMWGWIKIINHAQYDKKMYMSYLYVECRVEPVYRPLALTANHVVNVTCKVKMVVAGYAHLYRLHFDC